jgi:hypothetical protein
MYTRVAGESGRPLPLCQFISLPWLLRALRRPMMFHAVPLLAPVIVPVVSMTVFYGSSRRWIRWWLGR